MTNDSKKKPFFSFYIFLLFCFNLIFFITNHSWARKFDFKTENFSAYFLLEVSKLKIKNKAFELSKDSTTSFSKEYKLLSGAAFGFVITASEWVNLNLGFNLSRSSLDTKGYNKNASIEKFSLRSRMLILNPDFSLEFKIYRSTFQRFYAFISGGGGILQLENDYQFTQEGLEDFNLNENQKNLNESLNSYFISKKIGAGWETLLVDIATVFLGFGYSQRSIKKLNFKKSTSTLFQGSVQKGDTAQYQDKSLRTFNLNQFFVYLGFRFYLL